MALDPKLVGTRTKEHVLRYDFRDVVLYALGCGAKRDDELAFLYEKHGPKVLPSFAVIPALAPNVELFESLGGNMLGIVHGGQSITLHKPIAPKGELVTTGMVKGIYDLRRLATCVVTTETRDGGGELVAETEWQIIYRLDGGFGGDRPPKSTRVKVPEREPDFVVEEATSKEQALLYRLCGDLNPLHADPDIAKEAGFDAPILHGLCTYGFVTRAVLKGCGASPDALKHLSGSFQKPFWPGDTLITRGFHEDGKVLLEVRSKDRDEVVFGNAFAELH